MDDFLKTALSILLALTASLNYATSLGNTGPSINYLSSLKHWSNSCQQLKKRPNKNWHYHRLLHERWLAVCNKWDETSVDTETEAEAFFRQNFNKHYDVRDNVLITGYYAPIIHACWMKQPGCDAPLYGLPRKNMQHLSRAKINQSSPELFPILAWTSRMDRFFLQVQGSGELVFNSGDHLHLGYAGKNHRAYTSIGRYLYQHDLISKEELSMKGIKNYLITHPTQQQPVFEKNASFVFFKAKPSQKVAGKLGAELKAELSAAVDNNWIPLGSMIEVETTDPFQHKKWNLLLTAQDTGGAINGIRHIDIYMGKGQAAGHWAGNMHQGGHITYYTPKLDLN
jgi:membrane-bound lytic murein transglycosylase A